MLSVPNITYCASHSFLSIAKYDIGTLTVSTITFTLFTLSLYLHFHFYHKSQNIAIDNSYRTVYNVVKYAFQNKYPKTEVPLHTGRMKYQRELILLKTSMVDHIHMKKLKT